MGRLEALCQRHGLKLTRPRRLVLDVLGDANDHPCASEIHQRAAFRRRISLGTVYRILNRLAEAGVLTRHSFGGKMRYEMAGRPHQHLVDVRSGQIVEIDDRDFATVIERAAERLGYRLIDFRLEVRGEPKSL
ncbi:Fur family transcriptional regulator [Reyranella sp.]|uniref:Fur family transcriptional regulator n=1 Tax=Reyranella sp. TaxID=1929291 RepID=UPI003D0B94A9